MRAESDADAEHQFVDRHPPIATAIPDARRSTAGKGRMHQQEQHAAPNDRLPAKRNVALNGHLLLSRMFYRLGRARSTIPSGGFAMQRFGDVLVENTLHVNDCDLPVPRAGRTALCTSTSYADPHVRDRHVLVARAGSVITWTGGCAVITAAPATPRTSAGINSRRACRHASTRNATASSSVMASSASAVLIVSRIPLAPTLGDAPETRRVSAPAGRARPMV